MDELRSDETWLVGAWKAKEGRLQADDVARRINFLVARVLRKRAASPDGWTVLYQDPGDGRFWELTYPQGEMQGGGPPELRVIAPQEVAKKYSFAP
jgi:immunity protein 27 of polymorphic toxin system